MRVGESDCSLVRSTLTPDTDGFAQGKGSHSGSGRKWLHDPPFKVSKDDENISVNQEEDDR